MLIRLTLPAIAALAFAQPALADPVDDLVASYMKASHIPGTAVAVVENGRITRLSGYGRANLEWESPVTPDTPFQIASASKIFAGVVLMRLVEQGKLGLDDSIGGYFGDAPDSWTGITVRQLASHSSGLADGISLPSSATAQEMAREAMTRPLAYEPGTRSRYGITDFVVMTAILEKVSGLSYPELLRREVVEPLGLTQTGFSMLSETGPVRSAIILPGRAVVYGWRDGAQRADEFLYPIRTYAAGGLYSSVRDIATLMQALEAGRLLSAESFDLLTRPVRLKDGSSGDFGVGWTFGRYRGVATTGHSGGPALADVLYIAERGLTVVVLTNQRRFYPLLAQSIADFSLPEPPARPTIADHRPALTTALRELLVAAVAGPAPETLFTEGEGRGAVGFYRDFGQAMLVAVGPIRSIDLLSDEATHAGVGRLYRVAFARRTLNFMVRADAHGRFDEVRPLYGDG
ncbi:MAG: serine hydrolase domain-containing protein [Phenylobacterium sp.]|nr:serine hydrolase domain-containing protein [Phenylobacterium sp.]